MTKSINTPAANEIVTLFNRIYFLMDQYQEDAIPLGLHKASSKSLFSRMRLFLHNCLKPTKKDEYVRKTHKANLKAKKSKNL